MKVHLTVFLLAATLASSIPVAQADAPPPPNPADDAGAIWPTRREQLRLEWLKLLGPFPLANHHWI